MGGAEDGSQVKSEALEWVMDHVPPIPVLVPDTEVLVLPWTHRKRTQLSNILRFTVNGRNVKACWGLYTGL